MPTVPFSFLNDIEARLKELGLFSMDLTLDRVARCLARLELTRPRPAVVQVVGTNGKGSTARYVAALATAHGLRAGLFTSPHLVRFTERCTVDGAALSETAWVDAANTVLEEGGGEDLTYFEFILALGMVAFDRAACEVIVLEAGLGGRFDATTAVASDVLALTPVARDHAHILGPELTDIARDKSHAMGPGRPRWVAVAAHQEPEVAEVLRARATASGVALTLGEALPPFPCEAPPTYQAGNQHLAWAAWRALTTGLGVTPRANVEQQTLRETVIPGRLQTVAAAPGLHPPLILDGAHNAHGLAALRRSLKGLNIRPSVLVVACFADKATEEFVSGIAGVAREFACRVVVPGLAASSRERPQDPADLARRLGGEVTTDLAAALRAVAGDAGPVLVCGSLYLLGEFYTLRPELSPPAV